MITPSQLGAEEFTTPLTATQVINILGLVKRYRGYALSYAQYADLPLKLAEEVAVPTEKTLVLKAVLTALDATPSVVVESEGSQDEPALYTTPANWDALAQDVLDALYVLPFLAFGAQRFAMAQHPLPDVTDLEPILVLPKDLKPRRRNRVIDEGGIW